VSAGDERQSAAARTAAIVPAAGRGKRLGAGRAKALRLLDGTPLLVHVTRTLASSSYVDLVVVAAPPDDVLEVHDLLAGEHQGADLVVVEGGSTRQESVRRALAALPGGVDQVLVHDAARPLVPVELIDRVITAVRGGAAAVVPGVAVVDTVKRVQDARVVETLDRSALRAIQTPQGFRRDVIEAAHLAAPASDAMAPTDDAALVEATGIPIAVVPGDEAAFKVTRPLDLLLAEVVLAQRKASSVG
jgi:2-C-methyl-D-erythritol 4-phosphate cytidylyltransferase